MNKYAPHVYVIPEDDRDRQIAGGFVGHHQVKDPRIKVMPIAGGWPNVLKTFQEEYIRTQGNRITKGNVGKIGKIISRVGLSEISRKQGVFEIQYYSRLIVVANFAFGDISMSLEKCLENQEI